LDGLSDGLSDGLESEEPLSDEPLSELSSAMAGTATARAVMHTIPITRAIRADNADRQPRVPRCLPIPVLPAESSEVNEGVGQR